VQKQKVRHSEEAVANFISRRIPQRFRSSFDFPPRVKKIKVKSSGQECPLHTSKGNGKTKSKVRGDGRECPSHTVRVKVPPLRLPPRLPPRLRSGLRQEQGRLGLSKTRTGRPPAVRGGFEKRRPSRLRRLLPFSSLLFRVSPSGSGRSYYQKNCMY